MKAIPLAPEAVKSPVGVMEPMLLGWTAHWTLPLYPERVNCCCWKGSSVIPLGCTIAARTGNPKESVDNNSSKYLLRMVLFTTKSKVVLTLAYGHHEFPLVGTQVYT
jgi:hypothetical protein